MGIVVEDGSVVANANSYASEDAFDTYTDDRAITLADGDAEAALIRATAAIDAIYRNAFPGCKVGAREQSLEWPRAQAYDTAGVLIGSDEVPVEIVQATCEAAVRELASPGSMMPDLERGGGIRMLKAGSVEIEYGANAANTTTFMTIANLLSGLLGGGSSQYTAGVARG